MKLVLIEWEDSHSDVVKWLSLEEIKGNVEPLRCRSVGWLVHESKEGKVIVPHISGEKNEGTVPYGSGWMSIPSRAIVKMKVLKNVQG